MIEGEIAKQLSAYLRLKNGELAPAWMNHTDEQKTEDLQRHYFATQLERQHRRLQWPGAPRAWIDTNAQERDDQLANSIGISGQSTPYCDDVLALNAGEYASCAYDCEDLKAAYLPRVEGPVRCFVFSDGPNVEQQWQEIDKYPSDLLDIDAYLAATKVFDHPPNCRSGAE